MVELKEGAQVMLVRTLNASRGLVNGSRGVVDKFVGGALKLPVVRFANVSIPVSLRFCASLLLWFVSIPVAVLHLYCVCVAYVGTVMHWLPLLPQLTAEWLVTSKFGRVQSLVSLHSCMTSVPVSASVSD